MRGAGPQTNGQQGKSEKWQELFHHEEG
jgi:hypothetical protein